MIFKKPFVGRSFVSSVRTSLLVRFVLILGCIMEYQCFIRVLNWFAFVVAPSCPCAATHTQGPVLFIAPGPELALDGLAADMHKRIILLSA